MRRHSHVKYHLWRSLQWSNSHFKLWKHGTATYLSVSVRMMTVWQTLSPLLGQCKGNKDKCDAAIQIFSALHTYFYAPAALLLSTHVYSDLGHDSLFLQVFWAPHCSSHPNMLLLCSHYSLHLCHPLLVVLTKLPLSAYAHPALPSVPCECKL